VESRPITKSGILLVGYEDDENLGLRSIAAYLASRRIRVGIQHYNESNMQAVLSRILEENPAIVGFSLIFQRMLSNFAELVYSLRKNGVKSHFTIGGHFPTLAPKDTLTAIPGLDSVVCHEGELTLYELYQQLNDPGSWRDILGLAYRDNHNIHINPRRPLIDNLDALPDPIRWEYTKTHRGLGMRSILASRGCYYDCSFCSVRRFYSTAPGQLRRARSPGRVVNEMQRLYDDHGVRIFIFKDDDLCTRGRRHREWIHDFARELRTSSLASKVVWRISCRVDDVDYDLLSELREVGLRFLYIGVESGNDTSLKSFNKHYRVEDANKAIAVVRKLGLIFAFGFMMFDPDSTFASIEQNVEFLSMHGKPGDVAVTFTKMFPYVGTPIANRLAAEGRLHGTVESPTYEFSDQRLNLLELFCSQAFGFRDYLTRGLVGLLEVGLFDTVIVREFFAKQYDADGYATEVSRLVRRSNESAMATLGMVRDFMAERSYQEIIFNWPVIETFARREDAFQKGLLRLIRTVLLNYGLNPAQFETRQN
jgi:anaerobic magnesium-protoporphyrin IX monomethyl ester cyclase